MNKEETIEEWRTAKYLKKDGTVLVFPKYEVSSIGRVRALDYRHTKKTRILSPNDSKGYYQVPIYKNNKMHTCNIHRLVASTFLEIPEDPKMYECINHKDEDKHNNNVNNIEWCTNGYNINYGARTEKQVKTQINRKDLSKIVLQINPETLDVIAEYPSTHEAARMIGSAMQSIAAAIHSNAKLYGYIWKYK